MALRFIDGFETYGPVNTSVVDLQEAMSGRWESLQWSSGAATNISIQAGAHTGLSLFLDGGSNYITKTLDAQQTWVIGFWVNWANFFNALRTFLIIYDEETYMCRVRRNVGDKLELWTNGVKRGETAALNEDQWYFLEVKFVIDTTSSGYYELKLDDTTIISGNAITSRSGNNYANAMVLRNDFNEVYIDDLYICDGTTGLNDFLGPCKVNVTYPTSDSAPSTWTTSTGVNHYALVNDSERDTSDYVYTDTDTNEDMFNFSVGTPGTILGIQLGIECASNGTEVKEFQAIVRNVNDSTVSKALIGGANTPQSILVIAEYLPGTTTVWSDSTINATDFGCKKVS